MLSFPTESPSSLVTPPRAPTIIIGITWALFKFHILIISLCRSWYFPIFSPSFSLSLESPGIAMSTIKQFLSSLLMITMPGLLLLLLLSSNYSSLLASLEWVATSHLSVLELSSEFWLMLIVQISALCGLSAPRGYPSNLSVNILRAPMITGVLVTLHVPKRFDLYYYYYYY